MLLCSPKTVKTGSRDQNELKAAEGCVQRLPVLSTLSSSSWSTSLCRRLTELCASVSFSFAALRSSSSRLLSLEHSNTRVYFKDHTLHPGLQWEHLHIHRRPVCYSSTGMKHKPLAAGHHLTPGAEPLTASHGSTSHWYHTLTLHHITSGSTTSPGWTQR